MPIYKFTCECGKSKEEIVKMGTEKIPCECGKEAKKDFLGSLLFSSTGLPNGHNSIRGKIRR